MKKFRLLSAFLVILSAISFTACSDEDPEMLENGGGDLTGPGTFRANFDERQYIVNGEEVTANVVGTSGVTITATDEETGESITLSFVGNKINDKEEDTGYSITAATYVGADGVYTNANPATGAKNGKVKLSAIDVANKTISGFFSFMCWNAAGQSKSIFNGRFETIVYTGTLPAPGVEYFRAKVNGTLTEFSDITAPNTNGVRSLRGSIPANSIVQFLYATGVEPAVGVFPLAENPADGIVGTYTAIGTATDYVSTSGSLRINEKIGGWVEGTFSFTGTASNGQLIEITEGEFYIKLD